MFSFRETLKNAFSEWVSKGVLVELDIAEIQKAIDGQYDVTNPEIEEPNI